MQKMAPLIDDADYDAGEMSGNEPSQWSDAGNHHSYCSRAPLNSFALLVLRASGSAFPLYCVDPLQNHCSSALLYPDTYLPSQAAS
ncbi:unnamed protein product [Protopolystoma xenopodis]|uniref:Uncharacterized protein n=1 Tax=Protopolystoma xenopodis TaxID=117903 RepID=A0A3S4ZPR6_9PLAT|nr:unnamed protein product [Protopolystoma xenopodis]